MAANLVVKVLEGIALLAEMQADQMRAIEGLAIKNDDVLREAIQSMKQHHEALKHATGLIFPAGWY